MLISYLSDDSRGPSVARQRDIILAQGFKPEREYIGAELEMLGLILREDVGDQMVIAHHRAFVGPKLSGFVLDALARAGATLTLVGEADFDPSSDHDRARFLALAAKRWKAHGSARSAKREGKRGRPTAFTPPTASDLKTLKIMWWRKKTTADPEGYAPAAVFEFASELLGYTVERHHMQHWISELRQRPDDGLAKIERSDKKGRADD